MRTNKNRTKIILAVIVAFLATVVSYSAFSNMNKKITDQQSVIAYMQQNVPKNAQETYAYAVSTKNLKSGEIISDSDVDFQKFDVQQQGAFDNRSEVVNKVLLKDISSGSIFTSEHIAKISQDNFELKEGCRALTLPASGFQGKSTAMNVGSFVDVYNSSSSGNWVLENVRIIGLEGNSGPVSSIMKASAITFEVAAGNISDFISNASRNKLTLVTGGKVPPVNTVQKARKMDDYLNASSSLPNLPSTVPITDLGLPDPMMPEIPQQSVELIEANVKTKVTFD